MQSNQIKSLKDDLTNTDPREALLRHAVGDTGNSEFGLDRNIILASKTVEQEEDGLNQMKNKSLDRSKK